MFLIIALCLTFLPASAYAAGELEVQIPVSVELTGEAPSPEETFTAVLQAVDGAPMPATGTVEINGAGSAAFPAISYSTPGIYCYTVSQQAGSHERGHYDDTVYYVRVTVINGETGGLEAIIAAHTDQAMTGEKQDIVFANSYDPVPTATPTPTVTPEEKPQTTPTEDPDRVPGGEDDGTDGKDNGSDGKNDGATGTDDGSKGTDSSTGTDTASGKTSASTRRAVQTGDETNLMLWMGLLGAAGCVLCGALVFLYDRKRKEADK